jgi:hypothetical protein
VGQPGKAPVTSTEGQFRVPNRLTTGDYGLFVSVGERDGSPRLALPLGNDDGKHRYRLGSIHIRVDAQYRFTWQPPRKADNEWQLPVVFETLKPLPPNTQPFAHLDLDSRIAHGIGCALVEGNEALRQPGKHVGYLRLNAPDDAQGKTFDLHVGLWILRGQRLLAETGAIDRRIHLGTVSYAEDGTPVVTPR